jgi:tetratricopeptide (TPR) repeat protein
VVSAASCLALIAIAATSPATEARVLFNEGVALAKQERWEEALAKFEASKQLVERASTLFNIGTALVRLGRGAEAIPVLERFLTLEEQPERRKAAQDLIDEARGSVKPVEPPVDPPPPPPPPPPVVEVVPEPPPPPIVETAPEPEEESSFISSPWLWVVVGVVVVGTAIGIGVGVSQNRTEKPFGGSTGDVLQP